MYVVVQHKISDPAKFWSLGGFPDPIKVRASYQDQTGTKAVCLFEAASLDSLRNVLEGATSTISHNEYFEVATEKAMGLPTS